MRHLLVIFACSIGFYGMCQTTTLFPFGSSWKYNDNGVNLGDSWIQNSFADNAWQSGNAELGYGDGDEQTTVSYGGNSNNKHITTYFRKTFYVGNPSLFSAINGSIKRDDGAVVYVNGVEVFRTNMAGGTILSSTVASGTVAWPNEDDTHNFLFSPALLISGNNTIAVEIHQDEPSSSDISFDCSLSGDQSVQNITLTRTPYLQTATTQSIIIRWQTDIPTDSKVSYGTTFGSLNQQSVAYPFTTEHEIQLTNLQAGTVYYYTVGTNAQVLSPANTSQYFKTSPEVGTEAPFRFWVIGDAGEGDDNQRSVRDGFLSLNQNEHLDGWIMLGDNAYGNGINDGTQTCYQTGVFYNMYESILANTVLWPSLGNHEYNNHIPFSPAPAYFDIFTLPTNGEAGGVPSGTEKYYSYNYGNIHFVVLDSYDEDRSPAAPMAAWLINDLQQNTAEWTIAYWHHPPYTKGSHDSDNSNFLDGELVEIRENILPIIEEYGVDLVLNGHSHSYERSYLVDGHYGYSDELTADMVLDYGDGGALNDCPYRKETSTDISHKGTVYAVVGCSGKLSGTASGWPHPVMFHSDENTLGSMLLTVDHNKLSASFIGTDGSSTDHFTILKNAGIKDTLTVCPNTEITLIPSFPGPITWYPSGITADSLIVSPAFATMYIANSADACLADTFVVAMDQSPNCNLSLTDLNSNDPEFSAQFWDENTILSLIWSGFIDNNVQVAVYNIFGQNVYDKTIANQPDKNQLSIATEQMPSGTYFVRMTDHRNSIVRQFIRK